MALSYQDHLMGMMKEIMISKDQADVTLITDNNKFALLWGEAQLCLLIEKIPKEY